MDFRHNISILGSTGSIGTQTLDIVRAYPGIKVWAISAYSNIDLLEKQTREFAPDLVCVVDEEKAKEFKVRVSDLPVRVTSGKAGLSEVATYEKANIVVTAVVGISGLIPTIDAIKAGKNIALANKETLVTGGHIVTKLAREHNVSLLPVDSEHSAIFQSLQGAEKKIKRILLTASGGPFFGKTRDDLTNITPADALKHPNWDMGAKVTIDSSTLVNKGLEVIEAKWLFDVDIDDIEVLVHRQSILHSAVMFEDNAVIAQLGTPDMKLPIQYALTYPQRLPMKGNELDLAAYANLTFAKPDTDTFFALSLAKKAGKEGGIMPTIFNSSDEAAVELFLKNKISYLEISESIQNAMESIKNIENPTIEDIFEADKLARRLVYDRS
ncbi:MAG: 1-deoxy-D-xylulose-5-phosphate reductoisomerase [Ruminococcaceae bacterium]|nr:1-deoxy-D-xylulose-5-phosphate reductoisomerase [Oscillospiraceae bacterium]